MATLRSIYRRKIRKERAREKHRKNRGGGMRKSARGMWLRIDGSRVRFQLDRKAGLRVRRGRRRKERVVSFPELLALAEGQLTMNLV
jgi:hypothetical protein